MSSNECFSKTTTGNLTHENSLLAKLLSEKLKKSFPNAEIKYPSVDADVAAALYAINLLSSK